jgi:hypothetical protein
LGEGQSRAGREGQYIIRIGRSGSGSMAGRWWWTTQTTEAAGGGGGGEKKQQQQWSTGGRSSSVGREKRERGRGGAGGRCVANCSHLSALPALLVSLRCCGLERAANAPAPSRRRRLHCPLQAKLVSLTRRVTFKIAAASQLPRPRPPKKLSIPPAVPQSHAAWSWFRAPPWSSRVRSSAPPSRSFLLRPPPPSRARWEKARGK